jgi:hypothetical protein
MGIRVSQVESDDLPAKLSMAANALSLHRLLGFSAILQNAPRGAVETLIVAPRDEAHGSSVTPDDEGRKLDVAQLLVVQRYACHLHTPAMRH